MANWIPGIVSKHRQRDPDTFKPVPGAMRVGSDTSIRKLMRAARRAKLPEDRLFTIAEAQKSAAKRADKYLGSHARAMKALRQALSMQPAAE